MDDKLNCRQIFKATSIMGSSSLIAFIFSLVKTKVAAITIGKVGLGLVATYSVIQSLLVVIFSFGLPLSVLRHLVEAHTENNNELFSLIVITLRRTFLFFAFIAMIFTIFFSKQLSQINFDDFSFQQAFFWLSIAIFFSILLSGESLIIRTKGNIVEYGRINVINAIIACVVSVFFYFVFGTASIAPSLTLCAVFNYMFVRIISKQYFSQSLKHSWTQSYDLGKQMVSEGFFLLTSGLIFNLSSYLINFVIQKKLGIDGLGLYSATVGISALLINFVLNAMSTDYYPRLISVSSDSKLMSQYINNQIEVGMVLVIPGLIFLIIFAPLLVEIFYSKDYLMIVEPLRLFVFGYFFRVLSWPMGYVLLVKKLNKLFLLTEIASNCILIIATIFFVHFFGLIGSALGMIVLFVIHSIMMLLILRKIEKFEISKSVFEFICKILSLFLISLFLVFFNIQIMYRNLMSIFVYLILLFECYKKIKYMGLLDEFTSRIDNALKLKILRRD